MSAEAIELSLREFEALPEYSTTLPTGTTPGKRWRRAVRPWRDSPSDDWRMGEYGQPYPEGHRYHGEIPIFWRDIIVRGLPPQWPRSVRVPPPPMRGRAIPAPLGDDEGELCVRDLCLGTIEYRPNAELGGCFCPATMPPCSHCTSTMPECPGCGWRMDE